MSEIANRAELEWLFSRGKLSRRQFVTALAGLGLSASAIELVAGSEAPRVEAAARPAEYLVLMTLDAFRADYLTAAHLPAISALAKRGTSFDRAWVGQMESETPASHATISTGSIPAHDGVIGFEWRDPATGLKVDDGWSPGAIAGDLERDLRASGAGSIPQAIKAHDRSSIVVSLSSEKVHAASALGGWAADYILYYYPGASASAPMTPRALLGHQPPPHFLTDPRLTYPRPLQHFGDWDYMSALLALTAVEQLHPRALMVNFPGTDVYGHEFGGPATPAVMDAVIEAADRNVDRIVKAYQAAGIYDRTLFVVVGDHGMVQNDRGVASADIKAAVRSVGGQYMFHTGGTAADIYLRNPESAPTVAASVAKLPGVTAAYYRTISQGRQVYVPGPGVKLDPKLDAANRYLLDTFAGPTAPDVVAPFRENTVMEKYANAHGDHGGLNWGAQHVPLIFSGPGVPSGVVSHFPARLQDVAPTILRLLGLGPQKMDGVVLTDAIVGAPADDVKVRVAIEALLVGHQDALMQQAADNIAEDAKQQLHPPPSLPARP